MNEYRKYLMAALAPLVVWGTHALTVWSVTRSGLSTLIWAEAVALGVFSIPNDPAPEWEYGPPLTIPWPPITGATVTGETSGAATTPTDLPPAA